MHYNLFCRPIKYNQASWLARWMIVLSWKLSVCSTIPLATKLKFHGKAEGSMCMMP